MTIDEEILKPEVFSVIRYKEVEMWIAERKEQEAKANRKYRDNEHAIQMWLSEWDSEHPYPEPDCYSQEQMKKQKKLAREDAIKNTAFSTIPNAIIKKQKEKITRLENALNELLKELKILIKCSCHRPFSKGHGNFCELGKAEEIVKNALQEVEK